MIKYLSEQSDTLPQNCIWGLLSPHKERIILGHWRGYLNFTQVFYKVVIYLHRRLIIPGTSEHFNRFFEMSSRCDCLKAKNTEYYCNGDAPREHNAPFFFLVYS